MTARWECVPARAGGCYQLRHGGRIVALTAAADEISRECVERAAAALNALDGVGLGTINMLTAIGGFRCLCAAYAELTLAAEDYMADSDHYLGPIRSPSRERLRRALLALAETKGVIP